MNEFCVHIYPKFEYDEPGETNRHIKLVFDSKKQKESYVRAEWQFCFVEQSMYRSEKFENADRARDDLEKRRIVFAKNNGFAPSKTMPNEWPRSSSPEDLIA